MDISPIPTKDYKLLQKSVTYLTAGVDPVGFLGGILFY